MNPSEPTPEVSLVVPLFNQIQHTKLLYDHLKSTFFSNYRFEVIFTDDGSTDETKSWLANLNETNARIILNSENTGFGANVNRAVHFARGHILAIINNDLSLDSDWLSPMLAALGPVGRKIGVVGNIQYHGISGTLHHAGMQMTLSGQLEHINSIDSLKIKISCPPVLAVTGACMLLRRADFIDCGGFDEIYRNGAEDVDLCFKLRERGMKSVVAYESRVGHHVSASRGPASLNDEKNSRLLFKRWRGLLKQELADQWVKALHQGGPFPEPPETLVDVALLNTPYLAARRIAEVLLVRQEKRWAELLGDDGG